MLVNCNIKSLSAQLAVYAKSWQATISKKRKDQNIQTRWLNNQRCVILSFEPVVRSQMKSCVFENFKLRYSWNLSSLGCTYQMIFFVLIFKFWDFYRTLCWWKNWFVKVTHLGFSSQTEICYFLVSKIPL